MKRNMLESLITSSVHFFSTNLFWDVEVAKLDMERDKRFIIQRVLEYGTLSDWKIITNEYGINTIITEMQQVRALDNASLSFICTIANIKKETFRCYTLKQLHPQHWNF
jgi:hypothetical protein